MQPDRFRTLLDRDGPFVSVYFDTSHDTEDAAAQLELRWRAIRDELEAQGVEQQLSDGLQRAVLDGAPPVGHGGRTLVANSDGVLLDEALLRGPASPQVRISPLPYLVPVVEHGLQHPAYVLVAVDSTGADITVRRQGQDRNHSVDGGGYPVHKASSAETAGYGDPQPRAEEAVRHNMRAVSDKITALVDETAAEVVFVVGEVRARNDIESALIDDAAQQFVAARDGGTGLATEGLPGVCAALREGAVDTLIIGELDDRTVVLGDSLTEVAPNADVLSELGSAPNTTVRADEALPLLAVSTGSALIRTDERIDPTDGVAAVLRYARR